MIVCVPSFGPSMDSRVEPVFGRCEYFLLVDPETTNFKAISNPYAASSEDAGIKSAQLMVEKGVNVVLVSEIGKKAQQILETSGIKIAGTKAKSVREAVEIYRAQP